MTKKELIKEVAKRTNETNTNINKIVECLIDVVGESLAKEEKVIIGGLGVFNVKEMNPKKGFDPQRRTEIIIPSRKQVRFRVSLHLKDRVNH